MADKSPATLRLDPSPSKVFSWLEWESAAEESDHHPATSILRVRYRSTGAEWEFWPVSESEARRVMQPGREFDFSIGRAFGEVIKAYKSGRLVKSGERQATKKQRGEVEQRAGRRWLA